MIKLGISIVVAGALLAGCGGGEEQREEEFAGVSLEQQDPGPVHVHGLGVDPADGALYVATHTGLYRVGPGESKARLVGESRQDTMGFSVAGPRRFVGSGHPDPRSSLPPHLGLIESTDAGVTWEPVSLLGEADFHALRAAGRHVYGFDATNGRLLVSGDRGRTWEERPAPEPLLDLVTAPGKPLTVVAAGSVLYRSLDGGRAWNALGGEPALLAWPSVRALYRVVGSGEVAVSVDEGARWEPRGTIGGEPAAFLAVTAQELYAALHDGTILVSRDGGRNWSIRSRP